MRESERLEYKSSLSEWKEIIISLVSFANKSGGRIVVGVNDAGEPLGLQLGRGTLEDLANKIRNHTDPVLYPSINAKTHGPGEILEIDVAESDYKPVFAFDRAYIRVGRTNQRVSNAALRELMRRYTLPDYDMGYIPVALNPDELDDIAIKTFAKAAGIKVKSAKPSEILRKADLIHEDKLTRVGYLCFAKKNQRLRNAIVKAGRFKGSTMSTIIDMKDFDGNLPSAIESVLSFIQRHTSMEVVISEKARRDEVWDYPMPALREAVVNALVHRDYNDPGTIQIRIFDDRLEVWSPGLLPKELNARRLEHEHRSIPRNKKLAEIFHALGLIESWGSGFSRIISWVRQNGTRDPVFKEVAGAFVVVFPRERRAGGAIGGVKGGANGGASGGVNNPVVEYIRLHSGKRLNTLALALGIPAKTLEKRLAKLRAQGLVEFRGATKTGGYFVR